MNCVEVLRGSVQLSEPMLEEMVGAVEIGAQTPGCRGPVLAGGRLWLVSGDGLLIGADARSGQVLSNLDLGTAVYVSPVVAGGRMFILADNATLIALN